VKFKKISTLQIGAFIMLRNYFKVALRNIIRQKGYSFINITGLALGMSCCLLIMLWVMDELSYDRFHSNADRIYRIEQDQFYSERTFHVNVTPYPMAQGCKDEIPEIEYATPMPETGTLLCRYGEKAFFEQNVLAVQPDFLSMFSFPLIRGEREGALQQPHSLLITRRMAEKYFGEEDPLGKVLTVNNKFDFTVEGVLENIPTNSIIQFDMILPYEFLKDLGFGYLESWGSNNIITVVQLHENADIEAVNEKITDLRFRRVEELFEDDPEGLVQFQKRRKTAFMLMPLTDIHLHSYFGYSRSMGRILYVYVFSIIALFILLIACINFMNLSTARSAKRAREVGLRKVVGAARRQLIGQFYGESILLAFIGLIFALLLVTLVLPEFGSLAEKDFSEASLFQTKFIVGMLMVTLLTGLVSGSYPALFLSSVIPVQVLKGALSSGSRGSAFRKILVVLQFTLSIMLIIGTIVIYNQVNFMRSKELGYDKEHLLYIPLRGDTREKFDLLKQELLEEGKVLQVTGTGHTPANIGSNTSGFDWPGKDPDYSILISVNPVGFDYVETMKIEVLEGRSFSNQFSSDTADAFMVNEEMVRIMGMESAVNQRLSYGSTDGAIIGVMKNYHFQPVNRKIEPLALHVNPNRLNYMVIRLQAGDIPAAIDYVKTTWQRVIPAYPFDYKFVDQDIDRMYKGWEDMGKLLNYFTILAILIASLGLFGLASFTAEQRTKEIGVRKVLGASVRQVVLLISKEFTKWVLVANLIAWPISYYVMNNWLQGFDYRISMSWWIFISSGLLALFIALLTVSFQSIKAALANPVDALKYE
jgi:ABC-type antimicrobial peptide transport system permease subunit